MAGIKINGDTSGSTTITAPDTGTDETIELSTALASKLDLAGGKILQVVRATDTTNRSTTSTSIVDVTGMSVTITPQKSDSAVIIMAFGLATAAATTSADTYARFLITDSSNNAISGAEAHSGVGIAGNVLVGTNKSYRGFLALVAYATPATTSAVTYKLRFQVDDSNVTAGLQNGTVTGQIYAIEVSA